MNYNDIFMTNMILGSVSKISTGYLILDIFYSFIISSVLFYVIQSDFKNNMFEKVESLFNIFNKTNKLIFSSIEKGTSMRYRAIMHYISKINNPSIKVLNEVFEMKYNHKTDEYEDKKLGLYRVDQPMKFSIINNINGIVYCKSKERQDSYGKIGMIEVLYLEIFSTKLSLIELESWVEMKLKEYQDFIRIKSSDKQLLIEVTYDIKEKEIDLFYNPWDSNVTFENRFFTDKDMIVNKINFFIKNPEWYKKRGIPYTMGFLLWGEPGCGKTGFIKALMNHTGRHGVSIKLNNMFDMTKLRQIIYDEMLSNDLIIPQSNRILIFEDIDCMGTIVKDRDIKEEPKPKVEDSLLKKLSKSESNNNLFELLNPTQNLNNNLSYFLNILDGLMECPGRIIIMTTNKPEVLDKALIRPGRIDHNIHFTKATNDDIKSILEYYWDEKIKKSIFSSDIDMKYSHAEVVNICRMSTSLKNTIEKLSIHNPTIDKL